MDWKNQLTKTPYLVLFIVLISVGIGTASALITITLAGNVLVTGNLDVDGAISGPTISGINNELDLLGSGVDVAGVSIPQGTSVPGCEEFNECFLPNIVKIKVGGQVIWSNDDSAAHTVTSGDPGNGPDGIFDSSLFFAGEDFSHTFLESGIFPYFDLVHPWMTGFVIVGNGGNTAIDVKCEDCVNEIDISEDSIGGSEIAGTTKMIFGSCNLSIPDMTSGAFLADLPCPQAGVNIGDKVVANLSSGNFCHTVTWANGATDAVEFSLVNACSFSTGAITDIVHYIVFRP